MTEKTIKVLKELETNCTFKPLYNKLINSINEKDKINLIGYIDDPACDSHQQIDSDHQESPNRTKIIRNALKKYGFLEFIRRTGSVDIKKSDLIKVHDLLYVESIIKYAKLNKPVIIPSNSAELYANPDAVPLPSPDISMKNIDSLASILAAAASVMGAVDTICGDFKLRKNLRLKKHKTDKLKKVFCNVRPPGHHAHVDHGAGFCFMNNVVIGANYAMTKYANKIKKVLIFDWDLHHGDGTQNIVQNNPNIMYISFHRGGIDEEDYFYPGTGSEQTIDLIGPVIKTNTGNVFNFPIKASDTVETYMNKFVLAMNLAEEFKPDLVMISAGFDSHKDDLYHALPLDYIDFHKMTIRLAKLADTYAHGRLISVLEGGYTLDVLYKCVLIHIASLVEY